MDYIEGGFPLSNPKDAAFFQEVPNLKLKTAKIAAFGMTRRRGMKAEEDPGMRALLDAQTPVVTIVGKTSEFQVRNVLGVTPEENLEMIADSVRLLRSEGRQVIYDAEHFFDAFGQNREYALRTLQAAQEAGASVLAFATPTAAACPEFVARAVAEAKKHVSAVLGIHTHNDAALAVANALAAIRAGAEHAQGTINGVGERCGNMDLIPLIANLQLKYNLDCLRPGSLQHLTEVSRFVYETANLNAVTGQPYVGSSAFAHKGGMHVHAVQKNAAPTSTYPPKPSATRRKILISELSGASNIAAKTGQKFDIENDKAALRRVLEKVQDLENAGYQFEAAEAASNCWCAKKSADTANSSIWIITASPSSSRTATSRSPKRRSSCASKASLEHHVAEGDGPVNALDGALRTSLHGALSADRQGSSDRLQGARDQLQG